MVVTRKSLDNDDEDISLFKSETEVFYLKITQRFAKEDQPPRN